MTPKIFGQKSLFSSSSSFLTISTHAENSTCECQIRNVTCRSLHKINSVKILPKTQKSVSECRIKNAYLKSNRKLQSKILGSFFILVWEKPPKKGFPVDIPTKSHLCL